MPTPQARVERFLFRALIRTTVATAVFCVATVFYMTSKIETLKERERAQLYFEIHRVSLGE